MEERDIKIGDQRGKRMITKYEDKKGKGGKRKMEERDDKMDEQID